MLKKYSSICLIPLITLLLLFTASCESEYITVYKDIPGDTLYQSGDAFIKNFTVQAYDDQQPVKAAIVNDTIKLLWVSYHTIPQTIKPQINVADKARISPASGEEVPFEDGVKYTVTSEAGTLKEYILKIDFRQPEPKSFRFAMEGSTYNIGSTQKILVSHDEFDDLWFNMDHTRAYFVSAEDRKTEYDCEIAYFGPGTYTQPFVNYGMYFYIPVDMPPGKYDFRIKNGEYLLRDKDESMHFNVDITDDPDYLQVSTFDAYKTMAAGSTFTVRGVNLHMPVTSVVIAKNNSSSAVHYPLEIITRSRYSATFKLPSQIPADTYNNMIFFNGNIRKNSGYRITVSN